MNLSSSTFVFYPRHAQYNYYYFFIVNHRWFFLCFRCVQHGHEGLIVVKGTKKQVGVTT